MQPPPTFTLTEQFALGGEYSWRLKDSQIRYRGSERFANQVLQRIPATPGQVDDFVALLDLLDVWNWDSNYDSFDAGWMVEDGSTWTFAASIEGRSCKTGGSNAYPSIRSISVPSIQQSRFALLVAGLYDIFGVHAYIERAKQVAALMAKQADEQ